MPSYLFAIILVPLGLLSLFAPFFVNEPSLEGSAHVNVCSDKEVFDTFTVVAKSWPQLLTSKAASAAFEPIRVSDSG